MIHKFKEIDDKLLIMSDFTERKFVILDLKREREDCLKVLRDLEVAITHNG